MGLDLRPLSLRRLLLALAALLGLWALAVWLAGGIGIRLDPLRASFKDPAGALLAALLSTTAACAPWTQAQWRKAMRPRRWRAAVRWARAWAGRRMWLAWTPAALLVLVGAARLARQWADARPLWLDEEMIALNLRDRSLSALTGALWLGQSAPFGWLATQRAALVACGAHELALRLLPVLFGMATLVTAFWIGRRFLSPLGAAVLALLCSFGQWTSFYSSELKHYSADTFWALLLPALAARVVEGMADETKTTRRFVVWWTCAAVGQWLANGALLVTPACALFIFAAACRRGRWRPARAFASTGLVWLASFGLHYYVSVRHSVGSGFLNDIWSFAMAPASGGPMAVLGWFAEQLEPFAAMPGGTASWLLFWLASSLGLALGRREALGAAFATVPLSAFLLSALRLVPLYGRVSLWVVPALYVGIALFVDLAVRDFRIHAKWLRLGLAGVVLAVGARLCSDVLARGWRDGDVGRSTESNHLLDDRSAVRWLALQRQPGDVLMTTELGQPALWWYGGVSLADPGRGAVQRDGAPVLVVGHSTYWRRCRRDNLAAALQRERRVLVYLGFRFDDVPKGFDALLLERLSALGTVEAVRSFAPEGRAAVVDLHLPGSKATTVEPKAAATSDSFEGCLTVRAAGRW